TGTRYVSEVLLSRTTGEKVIDISMPRLAPDGSFGGVVSISLQTSYFQKFHSDLLADEPGLAINMLREDGAIFTRSPVLDGAPERLSPQSPVMTSIRAGNRSGEMRGKSSVDGNERLLSFRQLGDYPIYLGSGMDLGEVNGAWMREMGVLAAFGLPPLVALFFTARVALRRTRDTLETAERLTHETLTRRRAEEALLQAQKLEALGRLTGGVAHDFNNALMVISNNLFLLRRKHPDAGTKEVDSIGRAVESATKLTRQLLAFSRRQALVPEHLHLQEKLPSMRELIAPVLGSQVALTVEVEPQTHAILVDAAELELALLNLAINARDAMPGGGSFRICARNFTGVAPPLVTGQAVVVEVSDSGSGIEADLLDKVFEPFFTTKPVDQGTGLGLSQVYGLCQRAGGTATIASVVGAGTTVSLFFPAIPDAPAPGAAVAARVNRQLDKSVLLVEDND
ncbi:MAG: hybrid sensor histidine kinase/response regulator, partial [Comamonadaceae bacterium]